MTRKKGPKTVYKKKSILRNNQIKVKWQLKVFFLRARKHGSSGFVYFDVVP